MGINILLLDDNDNDFHDWDYSRHALDSEFLNILNVLETEKNNGADSWRPKNLNIMKKLIDGWKIDKNAKQRYYQFCDILMSNNSIKIYISY